MPQEKLVQFTVEQYDAMVQKGILPRELRCELIEGEIIEMVPIGIAHSRVVTMLTNTLAIKVAGRALVSPQNPIVLMPLSEPQPDLTIITTDAYASGHPRPESILLVIEVADSSVRYDRTRKMPLYANKGVREAWLVDLGAGAVDVHRGPGPAGWAHSFRVTRGQTISPEAFPDIVLAVDDILGPIE